MRTQLCIYSHLLYVLWRGSKGNIFLSRLAREQTPPVQPEPVLLTCVRHPPAHRVLGRLWTGPRPIDLVFSPAEQTVRLHKAGRLDLLPLGAPPGRRRSEKYQTGAGGSELGRVWTRDGRNVFLGSSPLLGSSSRSCSSRVTSGWNSSYSSDAHTQLSWEEMVWKGCESAAAAEPLKSGESVAADTIGASYR